MGCLVLRGWWVLICCFVLGCWIVAVEILVVCGLKFVVLKLPVISLVSVVG